MGRTKKIRTEDELIAMLEAAEKRCQDIDRRAKEARKSEAEAKKRLEEHRAAERQRRMTTLLAELGPLGFTLDTDGDIQRIVGKIQATGVDCDETELHVLRSMRTLVESAGHTRIRTVEDVRRLADVLHQPREIQKSTKNTTISELVRRGYELITAKQQPSDTDKAV